MGEINYVYDEKIEKLQETVARLNRRAEKLGVPAIQLHIAGAEKIFTCPERVGSGFPGNPFESLDPNAWGEGAPIIEHVRAQATLTGDPPMLAGWTFMAVVDHLSNGIITRYPMADASFDLTPFRNADATCDHCQTNRKRHETFIVRHEDATSKRVGRTCLADFLGHHGDPRRLVGHLNLWGKAFEALEGAVAGGIGAGAATLELATFVALVSREISKHGWLSRGKAYEQRRQGEATADRAQSVYWNRGNAYLTPEERADQEPTAEDFEKARGAIEWARALTDSDVEDGDYLYNLRAVCQSDFIRPKRGGLAGSVLVAAGRVYAKAQAKAADAQKSNEHVGSVKERLTLDLTLVGLRDIDGFYGHSVLHRFEDAAGNLLVWFATNPDIIPTDDGDKRAMLVGETLSLAGTVKKQDDFRGRKQTSLSRVSCPKKKASKKRS